MEVIHEDNKRNALSLATVHPTRLDLTEEDLNGTLPIAKSSIWNGWALPGHGDQYHDCGFFYWKGCLNLSAHNVQTVDGKNYQGKIYAKGYRRSCGRAECPICYEKWASMAGHRASKRLQSYKARYRKPVHVIISPSQEDFDSLSYSSLRKKVILTLKNAGLVGGLLIVHPFRKYEGDWKISPHFHVIGYGWIKNTSEIFEKTGYLVKNLGVRNSVRSTILYQLSHAGVKKDIHTITWYGELSYNKLKFEFVQEKEICPICQGELYAISWVLTDRGPPIPEKEEEFFIDAEGWAEKTYTYYE